MTMLKLWIYVTLIYFIGVLEGISQCQNTFGILLGSIVENERGYSLTPSPDGEYIYVGGIKRDSALILKVSVSGKIQWSRTFDIVPGRADHIHRVFVDAEGMIGVAGTAGTQTNGGTIFALRYDPENNNVLWANEYISTSNNYNLGMIEIEPGGNYLLSNNPSVPNVAELVALDKNTGNVISQFSKHYDLGTAESIFDFTNHNGFLYGTGRFSDGGSVAEMRNTIFKVNPSNGNVSWMKLGHVDGNAQARLYGFDLVVYKDEIYSIYLGDPSGTSVDNTLVFMQKTNLNGDIIWLKQFDFPANNDWLDEIIESNGDLVILARNRVSPSDMILIKTNTEGVILWSKEYDFSTNDNATPLGSVQSQLIEVDDHYFFTAYAEESGNADMILVKTDLDGIIQDTCSATRSININVTTVSNPVFYTRQPIVNNYEPQRKSLSVQAGITTSILSTSICDNYIADRSFKEQMICEGDVFEGYSQTGVYQDTLINSVGCDSIRTLTLSVVPALFSLIETEICPGESYEGYVDSGTYVDTLISTFGCDSFRTIILSVALPTMIVNIDLCSGGNIYGYEDSGFYTDTIPGMLNACDTIRFLTLNVLPPITTTVETVVCPGDHYYNHTVSGVYTDTIVTSKGCDSIRTVDLQVIEVVTSTITADICSGSTHGHQLPGTYTDTLISAYGCDSIRTVSIEGVSRYIPNVFSPNQDNINDLFEIVAYPVNEIDVTYFAIFDRFGNMAYETRNWPISWEGKDKQGKFYNPAVFTYLLTYLCGHNQKVETGTITLIR